MNDSHPHKDLVRGFTEASNARDYDRLSTIVSPDFRRHCPATPDVEVRSFDDFRRFLERDTETFPDNRVELDTLVAEGDRVAFWATFTGTQAGPMGPFPASGKRISVEFAGVFRVADGRLSELRVTWDNVGMLAQLGQLPP